MLQNLRIDIRKKPCNKNDAPAEMLGEWLDVSTSSKKRTNPQSTHIPEVWSSPAPSPTKLEESEFVVDSGASVQMLSRKDLKLAGFGDCSSIPKPYNGYHSQWRSAKNEEQCASKTMMYQWQYKSSKIRLQSYRWETLQRSRDCPYEWAVVKKHSWPSPGLSTYSPASTSHGSDSERPTKWATSESIVVILTHFPKDRNWEVWQ